MNNKGFAITTMVFGTMILFMLLLISLLGMLSTQRNTLQKLVDSPGGTRDNLVINKAHFNTLNGFYESLGKNELDQVGLYCFGMGANEKCKYVINNDISGFIIPEVNIDPISYSYTGDVQEFIAPVDGYYLIDLYGAKGGDGYYSYSGSGISNYVGTGAKVIGASGGVSSGYIRLNANEKLYVYVGGSGENGKTGSNASGGFNGGGFGSLHYQGGAGGGGATDIRTSDGVNIYDNIPNNGTVYYGPYLKTSGGYYQVEIYGSNLTKCSYSAYEHNGGGSAQVNYAIARQSGSDTHLTLYVDVNTAANGTGLEINVNGVGKCAVTKELFSKLESRIMVAGGGAGVSNYTNAVAGGVGGNLIAAKGILNVGNVSHTLAMGGKQNAGGTAGGSSVGWFGQNGIFGIGGNTQNAHGSGGGGGYYGGGGAGYTNSGVSSGAGGSSFISGYAGSNAKTADGRSHTNNPIHYSGKYFLNGEMKNTVYNDNGKAVISYAGDSLDRSNSTVLNGVRYIKDCINGSNLNAGNHWVELQAISNGNNLAKGKTVTGTVAARTDAGSGSYNSIVNGDISSNYAESTALGNQCITVDLGAVNNLDEIAVWHYYEDGRTYRDNITYVSNDNVNWKEAINMSAAETTNGKRVSAYLR